MDRSALPALILPLLNRSSSPLLLQTPNLIIQQRDLNLDTQHFLLEYIPEIIIRKRPQRNPL